MAMVYQHIRKDNNQVFYIGIGSNNKRAYCEQGRNKYWNRIVKKYGYNVEIIYPDLTWELACNMEKYLIKNYGRKDLSTGELVNLTDGGEGTIGVKWSEEFKLNMSNITKGRVFSEKHKLKLKEARKKQIPPGLGKKASNETKKKLSELNLGKNNPMFGKIMSEENKLKISERLKGNKHSLVFKQSKETIEKRRLQQIGKKCPSPIVICPYCKKEGASRVMTRFHFNNCKFKNQ